MRTLLRRRRRTASTEPGATHATADMRRQVGAKVFERNMEGAIREEVADRHAAELAAPR